MDIALWAIIGGALLLAEFAMPELVVIFFGLGALLNAFLLALIPALRGNIPLQIVLWAGSSGLALALLRRYAARWFRGDGVETQPAGVGERAEVVEAITAEQPGRIRFHGTTWQARAVQETILAGTTVTILEKENLTYLVTREELLEEHHPEHDQP